MTELEVIRGFRTKNRIPALCYVHPKFSEDGSVSLSGLWRSGQIKTGITFSRKAEDEKFISLIGNLLHFNGRSRVTVFDCRPWKNAAANMLAGKGYLNSKNYNLDEIIFGDIDNIHTMRSCAKSNHSDFFREKASSSMVEWYRHIQKLLVGAKKCAKLIVRGSTVVVNCSDGWDRTPQTTSLVKILLNKFFRTFNGFQVLVNYEFVGFGHKFQDRQSYADSSESSPVFVQFLECVRQILLQNPNEFEFNQFYLKDLALAFHENRFKDFCFNQFRVSQS
jgi:myotubularin-related protein 1/2